MVPPDNTEVAQETPEQGQILVEVAYALPKVQSLISLTIAPGSTVKDAIDASGILQQFPEIDLEKNPVGIFSKKTSLDHPLRERDRVEIYRPLIADPKQVRKQRAAQGKTMRKGGSTTDSL